MSPAPLSPNVLVAAIVGHRPEKIQDFPFIMEQLSYAFKVFEVGQVIQGMAAGVDLESAVIAHMEYIPFVCARPWAGHSPRVADRDTYNWAIKNSAKVHVCNPSLVYPGPFVYQRRNEWMVDNSDMLISVWDGSKSGTANCVKYAIGKIPVWRIDPITQKVGWYAET